MARKIQVETQCRSRSAQVKRRTKEVDCAIAVVSDTLLSCGKHYFGQTGRCNNSGIIIHKAFLKGQPCSKLSLHCSEYGCSLSFDDTVVKAKFMDRVVLEIN